MSLPGTIARRSFLIGSAAIAGGVAFGVYTVKSPHPNPLEDDLSDGEATFNPWVKISSEKITLITPHADIGQGVVHMQAVLIAEEMDLDLGQFETEFGEPNAAYYNRGMSSEVSEGIAAVTPMTEGLAQAAIGSVLKVAGIQVTGGSSSVPDSFDKLREAGAVARETLKEAASKRERVPLKDLRTESGAVILPDGQRIAYTDLAGDAAKIRPARSFTLKEPADWRLIGKPMVRSDIVAKSTGTQTFGIDLKMAGMVHAAVRINPRRGPVNSYDARNAEALPGVSRILNVTNGVAVIASNTWTAFEGARRIDIDWGPSAYPADQNDHWAAIAASFGDQERFNAQWRDDGNVDRIFTDDNTISTEYRAPYVAHQPLEPLNAIVLVTDEQVDVWAGHQMPRFVQTVVARTTGHRPEQVKFHNQYSGGSFGHRLEFDNLIYSAEIANQMRGTPVKLTFTREEDFAQDYPRHIAMARARGVVADRKVKAMQIDVAGAPIMASQMGRIGIAAGGPDSQLAAGIWNAPYAVDNFRVRAYAVPGLAPTSSWRSVGASFGGFFIESAVDEFLAAAGADPVEGRLAMINDPVARGVLEAAAEMAGWGRDPGADKGLGVALVQSFGVNVAEIVEVTNTSRGIRIDKVWVAADVGTVVDPINIENHIQGAVVWGLGHAMNSEITYKDGIPEQTNYHAAEGIRLHQCPEIFVRTLENSSSVKGIGEPPVPPAPPALANAIYNATGKRLREMPFNRHIRFV